MPFINGYGGAFLIIGPSDSNDITIPTSSVTPGYIAPASMIASKLITLTDPLTGTVRNDSGRTITMTGTINYNPNKGGGSPVSFFLVSERSDDGVTWVGNLDSKRTMEISNDTESFGTKLSLIVDWENGQYLRFRAWASGNLSFVSTTDTAMGQTFTTPSFSWELVEV